MIFRALIFSLYLFALLPHSSQARVRVALLEIFDAKGKVIQFTPGGRFGHSALEVNGQWLQAFPEHGVELVDSLEDYGHVAVILRTEDETGPTLEQVQPLLGLPFDRAYRWDTDDAFYCSELLGKLLGIAPEPMDFSAPVWPSWFRKHLQGAPGLSPDGIYRALKARGYREE